MVGWWSTPIGWFNAPFARVPFSARIKSREFLSCLLWHNHEGSRKLLAKRTPLQRADKTSAMSNHPQFQVEMIGVCTLIGFVVPLIKQVNNIEELESWSALMLVDLWGPQPDRNLQSLAPFPWLITWPSDSPQQTRAKHSAIEYETSWYEASEVTCAQKVEPFLILSSSDLRPSCFQRSPEAIQSSPGLGHVHFRMRGSPGETYGSLAALPGPGLAGCPSRWVPWQMSIFSVTDEIRWCHFLAVVFLTN